MKKYKIIFKSWNKQNEFKNICFDDNGRGYELEDANYIVSLLKTETHITNIEIVEI